MINIIYHGNFDIYPPYANYIETGTIITIPEWYALQILSDEHIAEKYGITIYGSPLLRTSMDNSDELKIPLIWDGINRSNDYITFNGGFRVRDEMQNGIIIAKAILIKLQEIY